MTILLYSAAVNGGFGDGDAGGERRDAEEVVPAGMSVAVALLARLTDRDGLLRWGQAGDRHMVRDGAEILRVLDLVAAHRAR